MTDPIRLSKRLAEQIGCSRREAELYIEGGWVSVDGHIIEAPYFKVAEQRIELLPGATATEQPPVTLLLHKPAGQPTAAEPADVLKQLAEAGHWSGDSSRQAPRERHYARQTALLPLEQDISGLVIFSQQREVIRKLADPRDMLEQEYIVEVAGEPEEGGLALLGKGIGHRGRVLPKAKASWQNETRLRVVLKNPQAGDLRQLCEAIGLEMLNCKRIRIGRLPMAKLPVGEWRFLGEHERF
ncbi:S4 domain-containing protein [Pseudomonas sp. MT-1]|uniref:RNA pseudouridine synthase n=1 Tax=Stutzerimonas stutzeri TaxID=316 RepID=UPI000535B5F2|nr:RNA pseudouridine synthase [Stutzerimonas stutzeri]MCQ4282642.1 RNA pseudouridine synthase [Stutzerimonas stutzeri]BAP80591.1 S4 domain-containing protein [Pseudomonas sp. MT-1]